MNNQPEIALDTGQTPIPCPYIYANGRVCTGHVTCIEAYKADVTWAFDKEGKWQFGFQARSHFHLFCSEKGNHAGFRKRDSDGMKFRFDQLPEPLQQIIDRTGP